MTEGSPDGEVLRQSRKKEGVFRPDSRDLITEANKAVSPEIMRVAELFGDKYKAERMIVLNCIRRVDESKSYLKNYHVANIFSAIALCIFLQSEHSEKIGNLFYEVRYSGGDRYRDILNVDSWTEKKSANIPAPIIDRLFIRTLVEKKRLTNYEPNFDHNRSFSSRKESATKAAQLVGDVLLEISNNVDIGSVMALVYGKESNMVLRWNDLNRLINEVKSGDCSKESFYRAIITEKGEDS